jgi:hypothetical protein
VDVVNKLLACVCKAAIGLSKSGGARVVRAVLHRLKRPSLLRLTREYAYPSSTTPAHKQAAAIGLSKSGGARAWKEGKFAATEQLLPTTQESQSNPAAVLTQHVALVMFEMLLAFGFST